MGVDPISLTMMGMAVAGAGITAAGKYSQGQATANNAAYQAQVAANNAKIAKQNEELEVESGEISAANSEMKTRARVGATLAGQGASGVDVNSGSFVGVRAGEAELGELDALTIRSNAARRAYGYAVQATQDTAQSGLLETESAQAKKAAPWTAAASLLSSASSIGPKYAMFNQVNPGGAAANDDILVGPQALGLDSFG